VLVGAISSGALAMASFLVVRSSRLQSSLEGDLQTARASLFQASSRLGFRTEPSDLKSLFRYFDRQGSFDTVAEFRNNVQNSDSRVAVISRVPRYVRNRARSVDLAYRRIRLHGDAYVVAGGKVPASDARLYFFFPEQGVQRNISELGTVLLTGWAFVVLGSAVVGILLARRMLRPVARASEAARSLAEGLLDTRLPVETKDEFGVWAMSFNEMAQALQAKITELSRAQERERRFTANVAHELRTPVGALVSEASILRQHLDAMPDSSRRPAQLLVDDVRRLRELLDDLLEMFRFESGRERLEIDSVDLAAVVNATIARRGWASLVRLHLTPVPMRSDRRRLDRIASNLIGNAIKHGGRDVRVAVSRRDDSALLEVSDRGPGIAPEHLPHLFEPFYKADASRTGAGSGLGLNIAHENARLLGGSIEVDSRQGNGARFVLTVPLSSNGEALEEPPEESAEEVAAEASEARPTLSHS
jgi:signal transduction histidine kinase